jgi:hypothetical protein
LVFSIGYWGGKELQHHSLASKFKGSTRMRRKLRIGLIAPGALNPPLQQQKAIALGLREESARSQAIRPIRCIRRIRVPL